MNNSANPLYKVSKDNWIKKGILTVKRYGIFALNIQETATKLDVTKGSFYHHFDSFNDYQIAIAEYWQDSILKELDKLSADSIPDAIVKFYELISIKEEIFFRTWAAYNPNIKKFITSIDNSRINFLKSLYLQKHNEKEAFSKAYLEYGDFIGLQQLFDYLSPEERKSVSKEFMLKFRH